MKLSDVKAKIGVKYVVSTHASQYPIDIPAITPGLVGMVPRVPAIGVEYGSVDIDNATQFTRMGDAESYARYVLKKNLQEWLEKMTKIYDVDTIARKFKLATDGKFRAQITVVGDIIEQIKHGIENVNYFEIPVQKFASGYFKHLDELYTEEDTVYVSYTHPKTRIKIGVYPAKITRVTVGSPFIKSSSEDSKVSYDLAVEEWEGTTNHYIVRVPFGESIADQRMSLYGTKVHISKEKATQHVVQEIDTMIDELSTIKDAVL